MAEANPKSLQFRPRARIIRTIGDQLISGPEAAVIELVKNAYDADASFVSVKFVPPLVRGQGRIIVRDDGHGMSLKDIEEKWMEPATSAKAISRLSPEKHRTMMGSKGIGRFAAAKLGQSMALMSVTDTPLGREEIVIPNIDWSIFDATTYLSDISIEFLEQDTLDPTGTTIEIDGLNEDWTEDRMQRLHRELRKLISPIRRAESEDEFRIFLDLSMCTAAFCGFDGLALLGSSRVGLETTESLPYDIRFEVQPFPLLTSCDYEVGGRFDPDGRFRGTMQIRRGGQEPEEVDLSVPLEADEQSCGEAGVHLYLFDRELEAIRQNLRRAGMGELNAKEARRILDNVTGIAIYREGFRVRPYGDPENDWLTLDSRRVQDPSFRIGHNQVAGYVTVEDQTTSGLEERSSREGFEENSSFRRLQRLIRELLAQVVEPRRFAFREKAGLSRTRNTTFEEVRRVSELQKIKQVLPMLKLEDRAAAEQIIDQQAAILADKIDFLEERQRVLEAKSSLGAIISEVLHEGIQPATYIATTANRLAKADLLLLTTRGERADALRDELTKKLPLMAKSGTRLVTLFENLQPLAGGKRGPLQFFNPINVLGAAADLFHHHAVEIEIHKPYRYCELVGYPEDLTTAAVNLIGNAVHWLEARKIDKARVDIRVDPDTTEASIFIDDNGPGIPPEFVESVFDVGFTLKDGGTGLGLNIAREALDRSGATLAYHPDYEGGTRFEIRFPCRGAGER